MSLSKRIRSNTPWIETLLLRFAESDHKIYQKQHQKPNILFQFFPDSQATKTQYCKMLQDATRGAGMIPSSGHERCMLHVAWPHQPSGCVLS